MVLIYLKWINDSKKIYFHTHSDLNIDNKKIKLRMSKNINRYVYLDSKIKRFY